MPNTDSSTMEFLKRKLETLQREGDESRVHAVIGNMESLHIELLNDPPDPGEIAQFKSLISEVLTSGENFKSLRNFMDLCSSFAERGRLDGFELACSMRTSLKVLDDEFLDWSKAESPRNRSLFIEDIEYIDETLEDVSDEAPPIREENIPEWISSSHWWWRAPKQQDMSEAERYSRIHYEEFGI